jgi:hypothetical protein
VSRLSTHPALPKLLPLLSGGLALLVYGLTLATDYTWAHQSADGGDLLTAVYTLGIPHPPGYPLYVWLGYPLAHAPWGSEIIAVRFHWLSAVSTAVAITLLTAIAQTLLHEQNRQSQTIASLTTALVFAFTPLVWQQALITEVYALNLALITLLFYTALTRRSPWLIGILAGLSSTTHLTSLLLYPLLLWLIPRHSWGRAGLGLLIGLTPWLTLFWLGQNEPSPVVWGDPTTLAGWWWLVSGTLYQPNLFAVPDVAERLVSWWWMWLWLAGAGVGVWLSGAEWRGVLAGAWFTALLYLLYGLGHGQPDALVFILPALLLLSCCLTFVWSKLRTPAIGLPLLLLALNWSTVSLAQEPPLVRAMVAQVLADVPHGRVLLTHGGDRTLFTLWYFQHVEGWRPDLIIVDSDLLAFDWYRQRLQRQHPQLNALTNDDLPAFTAANEPLCRLSLTPSPTLWCDP